MLQSTKPYRPGLAKLLKTQEMGTTELKLLSEADARFDKLSPLYQAPSSECGTPEKANENFHLVYMCGSQTQHQAHVLYGNFLPQKIWLLFVNLRIFI